MNASVMFCILRQYSASIVIFAILIYGFIYPIILNITNPMPDKKDLEKINAKIIDVKEFEPHLTLIRQDGKLLKVEFINTLMGKNIKSYIIDKNKILNSVNCRGEFSIKKVKFSLTERNRLIEANCGEILITYDLSINYLNDTGKYEKPLRYFGFLIGLAFFVAMFKREKRSES